MKRKFINRYTVSTLAVVLVAAAAVTLYAAKRNTADAAPAQAASSLAQKTPGQPQFSFDSSKAAGWKQGPTDKVSMAVFDEPHDCFVSVQYKPGKVDAAAELQKTQDMLRSGGYTSTPGEVLPATLQTATGPQQYQLHQFNASGSSGPKIKAGQEFGFVQLPNGYVKVEGWCDEPDQLATTLPVFSAISFKEDK